MMNYEAGPMKLAITDKVVKWFGMPGLDRNWTPTDLQNDPINQYTFDDQTHSPCFLGLKLKGRVLRAGSPALSNRASLA